MSNGRIAGSGRVPQQKQPDATGAPAPRTGKAEDAQVTQVDRDRALLQNAQQQSDAHGLSGPGALLGGQEPQMAPGGDPFPARFVKPGALFAKNRFADFFGKARFIKGDYAELKRDLGKLHEKLDNPDASVEDKLDAVANVRKKAEDFRAKRERQVAPNLKQKEQDRLDQRLAGSDKLLEGLDQTETALRYPSVVNGPYVPENEAAVDAGFARGNVSSVDKLTYKDGTVGVFKAEDPNANIAGAGTNSGIGNDGAPLNLIGRSVATSRLDHKLRLGLVPHTDFAHHGGNPGSLQHFARGQQLVGAEDAPAEFDEDMREDAEFYQSRGYDFYADGRRLSPDEVADPSIGPITVTKKVDTSLAAVDLSAPSMQKSMADAHALDILTGQVDRNPGNFILEQGPDGQTRARLIDNDMAFGQDFTELDGDSLKALNPNVLLHQMPRLVDAETARRVLAMKPEDLRASLSGTLLTEPELQAAEARLAKLQTHIRGLEQKGALVEDWNDQTFQQLLETNDNYVRRSLDDQTGALFGSPRWPGMVMGDIDNNQGRSLRNLAASWTDDQRAQFEHMIAGLPGDQQARIREHL